MLVLLLLISFTGCAKAIPPTQPALPPTLFLDSDGDGFNDWFEENIAQYDSTIPNDRYVVIYFRALDHPVLVLPYVVDELTQFFMEKGKIPAENIITLSQEEANSTSLENAINQIAEKSDENDIVLLTIRSHGDPGGFGDVRYTRLNEWLNRIKAKAIIVAIFACHCETVLSVMKDGSCPRIIYTYAAGEFVETLGEFPEYFVIADTKYGDGNGYISVNEIGDFLDNDPRWGPDWGELRDKGRSRYEAKGVSSWVDPCNISPEIYFTDYTLSE